MLFNIVEFCTYYSQNGLVIVNATDRILRMKEKDGTIVKIPSSVLPKGKLPKVYEQMAEELHTAPKKIFDGSIFINLKIEEWEVSKCVYAEVCKTVGNSVFDIISKINECHPCGRAIIVGTTTAARNFGDFGVVEPVYIEDNVIMGNKFKLYKNS
ncbi:MAG: hypothetical protein HFG32_13785 [Eubacterium sp.]|nr:hypothetical protein [Eubacterium sp.]